MSPSPASETATLTKVLLANATIPAGAEHRILPNLDVRKYDRIHLHIGRKAKGVAGLSVRVLFATPVASGALLADSTVWFEETVSEREFSWSAPLNYNGTGFIMSVPVVAPNLYDVILKNNGPQALDDVHVTLMAQEI